MEKSSLDQLRIERKPEKKSSSNGRYFLLAAFLLILAAAAGYFYGFRPAAAAEVQTAAAIKVSSQAMATFHSRSHLLPSLFFQIF